MNVNLVLVPILLMSLSATIIVFAYSWYKDAIASGESKFRALISAGCFFSILYFVMFILEPLLILLWQDGSAYYLVNMPKGRVWSLLSQALFYGLLGYVFFALGYRLKLARHVGRALPYFKINKARKSLYISIAIVYFLLSMVGLWLYGIDNILYIVLNPQGRIEALSGTGYLFFFVQFYLTAVLLIYSIQLDSPRPSKIWEFILWCLPVPILLFANRTNLLQIWLAMLIMYVLKSRKPKITKALLVVISILIVAGVFLFYRMHFSSNQGIYSLADIEEAPLKLLWSIRHALVPFDSLMVYFDVFQSNISYKYGSPFIEIFQYIIPSDIIGERPFDSAKELAQLSYPKVSENTGYPFTIVGFLHVNFSIPGIIVGMFVMGILLRVLNSYLVYHREQNSVIIIYSFVLARLFIVLWGVFYSGTLGYAQFFIQFAIAFAILGGFRLYRKRARKESEISVAI